MDIVPEPYGRFDCPICGIERNYTSKSGYVQAVKGNKPCVSCSTSIKAGGAGCVIKDGKQKCCYCQEYKEFDQFFKRKGQSGRHNACIQCSQEKASELYQNKYRFTRYGITKSDYDNLLQIQENRCAICKQEFSGKIHIDHCHDKQHVRGLLCELCNKGLGQFKDNINHLENAINYLKSWI